MRQYRIYQDLYTCRRGCCEISAQACRCSGFKKCPGRINSHKPRHADASLQNVSLSLSQLLPTLAGPHLSLNPAHVVVPLPHISSSPLKPTMRLPFLAALVGILTTSLAHNIQMGAHQRECFHEVLHRDDKMTVTFQVGDREFGGAGNLEIDFWVGAPRMLWAKQRLHYPGQRQTGAFPTLQAPSRPYCFRRPRLQSPANSLSNNR